MRDRAALPRTMKHFIVFVALIVGAMVVGVLLVYGP
jgi:hypothetical protein